MKKILFCLIVLVSCGECSKGEENIRKEIFKEERKTPAEKVTEEKEHAHAKDWGRYPNRNYA